MNLVEKLLVGSKCSPDGALESTNGLLSFSCISLCLLGASSSLQLVRVLMWAVKRSKMQFSQ